MADVTAIEWCDHTWSPWEGCQKVGPGCDHCFAEARNARYVPKGSPERGTAPNWGPGATRRMTADASWKKPLAWNRAAERAGKRATVFPSLCDPFDKHAPDGGRMRLAGVIRATPWLDWLLLTKRIGNALDMLIEMFPDGVPPNVRIGATIVNQAEWDRDRAKIAQARVAGGRRLFLSCEPMLGAIDFGAGWERLIEWVICGGESGHGARPMHPDWARSLRDQCAAVAVAFLMKQWGEYVTVFDRDIEDPDWRNCGRWEHERPRGSWWNIAGGTGFHGERVVYVDRLGKKAAGRVLDGVEHNGVPA